MSPQKPKTKIPAGKLALYDKLIQTNPEIERKGATMPYTSLNGNMFTFLSPAGSLAIRLPEEDRERFLKKYKTTLMKQHGSVLAEYVAVPDAMLKKTAELKKFLDISYEYAKTLKPKPAAGKKK
jgi:TfoX/Sxy family transcriptional regulator of competence genes